MKATAKLDNRLVKKAAAAMKVLRPVNVMGIAPAKPIAIVTTIFSAMALNNASTAAASMRAPPAMGIFQPAMKRPKAAHVLKTAAVKPMRIVMTENTAMAKKPVVPTINA